MQSYQVAITTVYQLWQKGDLERAKRALEQMPEEWALAPDALHLKALVLSDMRSYGDAIECFMAASKVIQSPELYCNLANTLCKTGRNKEAEYFYRQSLSLGALNLQATHGLVMLLEQQGRYSEAKTILKPLLALKAPGRLPYFLMGNIEKALGNLNEARENFQLAIRQDGNYLLARHNLAVVYRMQSLLREALAEIERCIQLSPGAARILRTKAQILFDMGRLDEAESCFQQVLKAEPDNAEVHHELNELLWQSGRTDRFLQSIENALPTSRAPFGLLAKKIELLQAAHRYDDVVRVVSSVNDAAASPAFLRAKSRAIAETSLEGAIQCLLRAEEMEATLEGQLLLCQQSLYSGDVELAQRSVSNALTFKPFDQLAWALQGSIWRQLKDERYGWLNNYDDFVRPLRLPAPNGYGSIGGFMEELSDFLLGLHRQIERPLQQTLMNGTQLPGNLLNKTDPVIRCLRSLIEQAVWSYIDALPDDRDHPLLARKPEVVRFSGSWSVKLAGGGYHVNHVHPDGWVSSSLYVSLPELSGNEGCLTLGQSSMLLGSLDEVEKLITPEVGMLVIFPSYVWHGTVPIQEHKTRITAPFDVAPRC